MCGCLLLTDLRFVVVCQGTLFNMFIISPALWGLAKVGAMGSSMIPMVDPTSSSGEPYDISQIRWVASAASCSRCHVRDPHIGQSAAVYGGRRIHKDTYNRHNTHNTHNTHTGHCYTHRHTDTQTHTEGTDKQKQTGDAERSLSFTNYLQLVTSITRKIVGTGSIYHPGSLTSVADMLDRL